MILGRRRSVVAGSLMIGVFGFAQSPVKIPSFTSTISGYLAKPAASNSPAALILAGTGDLSKTVLQATRTLSSNGIVALAIDYDPDRVSGQSDLVQSVAEGQIAERLKTAVDWLGKQTNHQQMTAVGWGRGADWVVKLVQQGDVQRGVIIEESECHAPDNLPTKPIAPILIVAGGCTPERKIELAKLDSNYRVNALEARIEPIPQGATGSEIFQFLKTKQENTAQESTAKADPRSKPSVSVDDIMRVINSDNGVKGQLARLLSPPAGGEVAWEQARSQTAVMLGSCDWLLVLGPPKGSAAGWRAHVGDFRSELETLQSAIGKHDLPASQKALSNLPQTCAACHRDYR